MRVIEPDVETGRDLGWDNVVSRVARIDARHLQVRRSEMCCSIIEAQRRQPIKHARQTAQRVDCLIRISDVPLSACDEQPAVQTAASADLDHLAKRSRVGWLAEQAVVRPLAMRRHPVEHLSSAIDGRAFFIASNEKADRASRRDAGAQEIKRRGNHAGNAAFHINRAAPPEFASFDNPGKRRMGPGRDVAWWDHIDMSSKTQMRAAFADPGIQVIDIRGIRRAEHKPMAREAGRFQRLLNDIKRCAAIGRDAGATDQIGGQSHWIGEFRIGDFAHSCGYRRGRLWLSTLVTPGAERVPDVLASESCCARPGHLSSFKNVAGNPDVDAPFLDLL